MAEHVFDEVFADLFAPVDQFADSLAPESEEISEVDTDDENR